MPLNQPLNQILYGPPGTGKTYETRRLAVAIIDGEDKVKEYKDETLLKKRYEELRTEGRIVFTTFIDRVKLILSIFVSCFRCFFIMPRYVGVL